MKTNHTIFLLPLLFFSLLSVNGWGQLATWNNGNVSTDMPLGATATGVNPSATSTARTGLSYTSSGARWNSASWNNASNCITITVTAATGYVLNLNGAAITFNMGSSGSGPTSFSLKSSVNAYGSVIANVTTVNGSSVQQGDRSYTLPATGYNGLSSITFKLFGNGASAATGTGGPSKLVVGGTAVLACTPTSSTITDSVCNNLLPYVWHSQSITMGGTNVATYTTQNAGGCDSVVHLNLVVKSTNTTTVNDTICNNQLPYTWNGITLTDGGMGIVQQYLQNAGGCDSIVTLNLVVKRPSSTVSDTICSSLLPYIWHGNIVNTGGVDIARDTVPSASGCDSIIHLNLTVKATSSSVVNDTICSSSLPYTWHGIVLNAGGLDVAKDTILNAAGCDSIIHLNLTIKATSSSVVNDTICSSSLPYTWHGIVLNAGGLDVARDTVMNAVGCDSIIHLNLYVNLVSSYTVNDTICNTALPYLWYGNSFTAGGLNIAQHTLVNAAGCDSILHLNLFIKPATHAIVNDTICNNALPYLWHGMQVSFGGMDVAQQVLVNSKGCDSIVHLNLYVRPAINIIVRDTVCNSALPYLWHGISVATGGSNVAQHTLATAAGCDSILHLNLFVKPTSSHTVNDTICNSALPYTWHGKLVYAGGLDVAKDTVPNATGCDSIISLNLYVRAAIHTTAKDTVCSTALPYLWHGKNITTGGLDVARDTVLSINSCDSIVHLNLVVKAASNYVDNRTTCHNLPYTWNGLTVNTLGANAATYHTLNVNGCDSMVLLNLSVHVDTTQVNMSINANALPYTWNGISIPSAGTAVASYTLTSSMGCDSVLVLNLSITSNPVPLTLVSFTGKANNDNNSLSWITVDETNLSHFELERSSNQQGFIMMAKLSAINSPAQHNYSYNDTGVNNHHVLYYRLKMIDFDGTSRYSNMVAVKRGMSMASIKSYPNPTPDVLNIEGLKDKVSYYITDVTGRVLQTISINISMERTVKINVAHLMRGAYFLHYQDGNGLGVIRFIKK